jgi:hypothetical protein
MARDLSRLRPRLVVVGPVRPFALSAGMISFVWCRRDLSNSFGTVRWCRQREKQMGPAGSCPTKVNFVSAEELGFQVGQV